MEDVILRGKARKSEKCNGINLPSALAAFSAAAVAFASSAAFLAAARSCLGVRPLSDSMEVYPI